MPGSVLDTGDSDELDTVSSRSLPSDRRISDRGRARGEDKMEKLERGRERASMAGVVRAGLSACPLLFFGLNYGSPTSQGLFLARQPPLLSRAPLPPCSHPASRRGTQRKRPLPSPLEISLPPSPEHLAKPQVAPGSCPSPTHLRYQRGHQAHCGHQREAPGEGVPPI